MLTNAWRSGVGVQMPISLTKWNKYKKETK